MPMFLPNQCSILRCVHAGKVKHGYIWLPIVVDGVVQRWQLVVCAKVSSLASVRQQSFLVNVVRIQQSLSFYVVLEYKKRNPKT